MSEAREIVVPIPDQHNAIRVEAFPGGWVWMSSDRGFNPQPLRCEQARAVGRALLDLAGPDPDVEARLLAAAHDFARHWEASEAEGWVQMHPDVDLRAESRAKLARIRALVEESIAAGKPDPAEDDVGDVVVFGRPRSTREVNVTVTGISRGKPLVVPEDWVGCEPDKPDPDALPPLLPELTAVQRVWVGARAAFLVDAGMPLRWDEAQQARNNALMVWAGNRWGHWVRQALQSIATGISMMRSEARS